MSEGDEAYHQGREAFAKGLKLSDNPHKKSGSLDQHWAQGWRYANAEQKYNKAIADGRKPPRWR